MAELAYNYDLDQEACGYVVEDGGVEVSERYSAPLVDKLMGITGETSGKELADSVMVANLNGDDFF